MRLHRKLLLALPQIDHTLGRAQGGLGIGLALVQRLVQMHGGDVAVRSEGLGKGSEFLVSLPLVPLDGHVVEGESAAKGTEPTLTGRRILVVDDNRDAAESLAMLLRFLEADVETAYDGASALEAIRRHRPADVFLDIGMPGMTGYDVARRVRREPHYRHVTLIALTGWGQDDDRRCARDAGFDHHMTKPADMAAQQRILLKPRPRAHP